MTHDMEPEAGEGLRMSHVFLIVLVLHVIIIGGAVAWHWVGDTGTGHVADQATPEPLSEEALIRQTEEELARSRDLYDDQMLAVDSQGQVHPADAGPSIDTNAEAIDTNAEAIAAMMPDDIPVDVVPMAPADLPSVDVPQPVRPEPTPIEANVQPQAIASIPAAESKGSQSAGTAEPVKSTKSGVAKASKVAKGSGDYTVVKGDTLTRIAKNHGVTVAALRSANNIQGDMIVVGQKLDIPKGAAGKSGTSIKAGTYVVSKGDTLNRIARRSKVPLKELLAANDLKDPDTLRIGQKIKIPRQTGKSKTSQSEGEDEEASALAKR